jgi:hypothetical protein
MTGMELIAVVPPQVGCREHFARTITIFYTATVVYLKQSRDFKYVISLMSPVDTFNFMVSPLKHF